MIYYICKILNLYRIIFSPSLSESSWLALYTFGQLSPSPWVVNINIVTIMVTMVVTIMVTTMMTMMVMIIYMTMIMTKESVQVVVFSFLTFITNEVLVHILSDIVHISSLRHCSHFLIVTLFTFSPWDIVTLFTSSHWEIVHIIWLRHCSHPEWHYGKTSLFGPDVRSWRCLSVCPMLLLNKVAGYNIHTLQVM